jgi:hypothetical protein
MKQDWYVNEYELLSNVILSLRQKFSFSMSLHNGSNNSHISLFNVYMWNTCQYMCDIGSKKYVDIWLMCIS